MELQQASHSHTFTLYEEDKDEDSQQEYCCICLEPVSRPSYRCTGCDLRTHRKCAEAPIEIEHPLHRRHHLKLHKESRNYTCDMCEGKIRSSIPFYYCYVCNFKIDIRCALLPNIMETTNHEHPFILLSKKIHFTCDACGEDGDYAPYLCSLCHLMVHKSCVPLPKVIKIIRHEHPINHTYFLHFLGEVELVNEFESLPCAICYFEVDMKRGCYYCMICAYVVHTLCATRSDVWDGKAKLVDERDSKKECNELILDSITNIFSKIKLGEEFVAMEIQHFSHEHMLQLCDEVYDDDTRCDGCMLPISPPFYICSPCNFVLHKTCVELPRIMEHPFHPHPLSLLSQAPYPSGIFVCNACSQVCHGFTYNCKRCSFNLDLRCSSIQYELNHDSHEHPLIAFFNARHRQKCESCDQVAHNKVKCVECDYAVDFICATLPYKAKHKCCDHGLSLTYQDDAKEKYCEVCEWERDPEHWFYYCSICNYEAHPICVLGEYPYLKLGKTYTCDAHEHPLIFVQKTRNYPLCSLCGKRCKELSLECEEHDCNYIIHWECRPLHSKSS